MAKPVYAVITSIQSPTACVVRLAERIAQESGELIVIGDRKGPPAFALDGTRFLPIEEQKALPFALASVLPENVYTRKNIGYLIAMQEGAPCIYETDDDNAPGPLWVLRTPEVTARKMADTPWVNIFRQYTSEHIWPRGFPLELITDSKTTDVPSDEPVMIDAPVQIGISDNSPDVDAIWRLTDNRAITFNPGPSFLLAPGTWAPFNSQDTWWFPPAYSLMYLPSLCTFRMTDIWRSFVAQKCLWAMQKGIVFVGPTTVQERNAHNLMNDFRDELPGYTGNMRVVEALGKLELSNDPSALQDNMRTCYQCFVDMNYLPKEELTLLDAWLSDVRTLTGQ